MNGIFGGIVLMGLASPAFAQNTVDCSRATAQADQNLCANEAFVVADADLKAVFEQATATARASDDTQSDDLRRATSALRHSQGGWLRYRNRHCELVTYNVRGSSTEPKRVSDCLTRLTRARIEELKTFVSGATQ